MDTTFLGRNNELNFLQSQYKKKNFFIPIYGRRRVGKTTLAKKFIQNKNYIYLLCRKTSIKENLTRLTQHIKDKFGIDYDISFNSFEEIFKFIKKKDIIIVIDEFPYLVELDKKIPSIFQSILDETLKESKISLLLVGSSVAMMEKHVLSKKSPLYGRRTGQINLKPLTFKEFTDFYPKLSPIDLVRIYGITGGVPYYMQSLKVNSYNEMIKEVFNKNNVFYEEGELLLREELREPRNYKLILKFISQGKNRFNEISQNTGIDKTALSHYLAILENLGFIIKEKPCLASSNTKKTSYRIKDNFLNFYFTFIDDYKDKIELGSDFSSDFKKSYNKYLGLVFEDIAKQFLINKKGMHFARQWGSYQKSVEGKIRNKTYEIDLLNINKNSKIITAFEVKWKSLTTKKCNIIIKDLKNKIKHLNLKGYKVRTGIVAKKIDSKKQNFYDLNNIIK